MTKQEWEEYKHWVTIELAAAENDVKDDGFLDGVKRVICTFLWEIDQYVDDLSSDSEALDKAMDYIPRITTQLMNHVLTSPITQGPDENESNWVPTELDFLESVRLKGLFYDKASNRFMDTNRIVCRTIDMAYRESDSYLPVKIDNVVIAAVENWFPVTLPYYPERLYVYLSCAYYADAKEPTPAKLLINKIVKHDANGQAKLCYNWVEEMKKPEKDRRLFCAAFDLDGAYKGQISTDEFMSMGGINVCKKESES